MRDGLIEQIGAPFEIYDRPATPYVAGFIGTLNVLQATALDPEEGSLLVEGQVVRAGRRIEARPGEARSLCLRPEALSLGGPGSNRLAAKLVNVKLHGAIVRLVARVGGQEVLVDCFNDRSLELPGIGADLSLAFAPESCAVERP
jgi:putative spermidine/putrescine transport system ATP-binding protein